MHTIFINTDDSLLDYRDGTVFRYLFAKQIGANKLSGDTARLDDLAASAGKISEMIDKDIQKDSEYNVLIYVDVPPDIEDADVFETMTLASVNEDFARALDRKGKRPQAVQVIFGEHFDRTQRFSKKRLDGENLWKELDLPDPDAVQDVLQRLSKSRQDEQKADKKLAEIFHTSQNTAFYRELTRVLIRAFTGKIESSIMPDPMEELSDAFSTLLDNRRKLFTKLQSLSLMISDADAHSENRCAYQLYLYVFCCAEFSTLHDSIPEPDWSLFANTLAVRQAVFRTERKHIGNITGSFDYLDTAALGGEKVNEGVLTELMPILREPPKLTGGFREIRNITRAWQLRRSVKETLDEVREKNAANCEKVLDFAVLVREDYIDNKGDVMEGRRRKYRWKKEGSRTVDSMELTLIKAKRFLEDTLGVITEQEKLQTATRDLSEEIRDVREKTDYLFDTLDIPDWKPALFTLLSALLFALPYGLLQRDLLTDSRTGTFLFIACIICVLALACAAYFHFRSQCKGQIKEEVLELINIFNREQQRLADSASQFRYRLATLYPRSDILHTYYRDALQHIEDLKDLSHHKEYHKRLLTGFADDYIDTLIYQLDLNHLIKRRDDPDDSYRFMLTDETVRKPSGELGPLYYLFDGPSIKRVLFGGDA